jgi:IclR family acetate operon transcriptional repressor
MGYAFENEEGEIGFRCVGASICDSGDRAVAAISIAGTTSQISDKRLASLASMVKTTAKQISAQLGAGSSRTGDSQRHGRGRVKR